MTLLLITILPMHSGRPLPAEENKVRPHRSCQLQKSTRHIRSPRFTNAKGIINIPRRSRGYFIDGQNPLLLAARVTSRWYGLSAAKDCYLLPVNGLRSSPWSIVLTLGPIPIDALCTQLSFVHSSPLYPHNILCTKIHGCGIYISIPETFHQASNCFSL